MKLSLKSNTTTINLNNFDAAEIGDVLLRIEKTFSIGFTDTDLKEIKTFGALCGLVVDKVKQHHADSCTTQQAFYKLRNAINSKNPVEKFMLKPQTKLSDIFPRDNRIEVVAEIETEMGFHMNLLQPKQWIIWVFAGLLLAAIVISFFNNIAGLIGGGGAILGLILAGKFGKELKVKTLGDLSEKIAREHFLKCRRDAATVSRAEVNEKVKTLFAEYFDVEPAALTKQARFA